MRFRYFDSDGTEVQLSSVDALRFRIGTGAVTPETLLYDAAVGGWAPAGSQKVYRFIAEEDGAPLPEELEDSHASGWDDVSVEALEETPLDEEPVASHSVPTPAPDPDAESLPRKARRWTREALANSDVLGWKSIPLNKGGKTFASRLGRRRRGRNPRARTGAGSRVRLVVLTLLLFVSAGVLLYQWDPTDSEVGSSSPLEAMMGIGLLEGSTGLRSGPGESGDASGSEDPVAATSSSATGGLVESGSGSTASVSGSDGSSAAAPANLERLALDVGIAVSADMDAAMEELQEGLGLPEGPPPVWLEGAYLADAGAHPDVREYWQGYGSYVASMRALEESLYRGFVQNRVLRMRLDTADASGLSAMILERYERSQGGRELVYRDLAELAAEALTLHETLSSRSASISYEPFLGGRLSRDPVIEAVADDPVLAERIWTSMDRIFERLERLQGLRPVSTARLQEALTGGLQIPHVGS